MEQQASVDRVRAFDTTTEALIAVPYGERALCARARRAGAARHDREWWRLSAWLVG